MGFSKPYSLLGKHNKRAETYGNKKAERSNFPSVHAQRI